jgi:bacteriocin biosynthesis cyclodehydratase domain-containing protein
MDRVLRFKGHLRPVPAADDQLVVLGERQRFLVEGRASVLAAPLLDGSRTVEQIVVELHQQVPPLEVLYAVESLASQGYLTQAEPAEQQLPPRETAFWEALAVPAASARERLHAACVQVVVLSDLDPRPLADALRESGVQVAQQARQLPLSAALTLRVVLVDDYLQPELEQLNREALQGGGTFILVKPRGVVPWIGPCFRPGRGACWQCLAHRLRANRPVEGHLQQLQASSLAPSGPTASLVSSERVALGMAALVISQWIARGGKGPVDDALLALDLDTISLERHPVVRRPSCAACARPDRCAGVAEPVKLVPRPKRFVSDGGHRINTPNQVCERLRPHLSPITGVVSSVGPVPGRDQQLRPVYGASWFTKPSSERLSRDDFHRTSLGKGRSPAQARASALGEAIERWSAQLQGDELRMRASLAELGDAAVHPAELLHFSETQYARREQTNAAARERAQHVPRPYDGRPIDWTPAWSLDEQRVRYLPTSFCYVDVPAAPDEPVCPYDSNGDAAGSCLEEAILQGLLEVVERDAAGLWWYSRARRPAVALESFGEPYFTELHRSFEHMGWQLWVLDLTTDLGLPCFVAYSHQPGSERFSIGFGCHLDASLAVMRALTENNQLLDATGQRPLPWCAADIQDPSYLLPDPALGTRSAQDYDASLTDTEDLLDEVQRCVQRARSCGLSTLVLDRTRADVPMSVVKVVVPGLRHFWPRFGPGRLYEIPLQLGWRSQPLTEAELNPVPLLI